MVEQLVEDSEKGVIISGEKIDIKLKEEGIYIIRYPEHYMKKEDFMWSIYSPKDYKAIEFGLKEIRMGFILSPIAKQHNSRYINSFTRKLEEMLADTQRLDEEYNREEKEINNLCKKFSEETIMKMLWSKERFDELYEMVALQNKLEQDANRAYKELSIIFKAEGLDISNE